MTKKPEHVPESQLALEKLKLFLVSKLSPEDYEKANGLIHRVVIEIAGDSYRNGVKAGYK